MFPGMNQRQMKQMMRQMGMTMDELEAEEVVIKTADKEYVFKNPEVQKMVMKGQATFQISGEYEENERKIESNISDEDVNTVAEQTGVEKEKAEKVLKEKNGDIAEAILHLNQQE